MIDSMREGSEKVDAFVFSKKGDSGETSLLTGERVSKASLRPEAYGTLDEASSAMGLAKALSGNVPLKEMISTVQEDLLVLGAELACERGKQTDYRIEPKRALRLERWIQELQADVPLPRQFIFPGGSAVSAAIDLARTIVRRAERCCVALREAGQLDNPEVHAYLNRLGDFLFTLARYAEEKG
ncbi:MAG TPA: cob(I)yrinic acid a,c-diamide adenosyltransferase [Syntrophobacteraceae bacterium]|nr:cob(I)yrinic acid a,c-diamide adenosyltransferase [Syntrophobacteraceae bacterium]